MEEWALVADVRRWGVGTLVTVKPMASSVRCRFGVDDVHLNFFDWAAGVSATLHGRVGSATTSEVRFRWTKAEVVEGRDGTA